MRTLLILVLNRIDISLAILLLFTMNPDVRAQHKQDFISLHSREERHLQFIYDRQFPLSYHSYSFKLRKQVLDSFLSSGPSFDTLLSRRLSLYKDDRIYAVTGRPGLSYQGNIYRFITIDVVLEKENKEIVFLYSDLFGLIGSQESDKEGGLLEEARIYLKKPAQSMKSKDKDLLSKIQLRIKEDIRFFNDVQSGLNEIAIEQ